MGYCFALVFLWVKIMSPWFTKHQKRTFFAVTLIRRPNPAVTGQNSIFWGFSGYTGDISQGYFFIAEWYLWTKKHRE